MSNLPAPLDPNLLPALHEGLSLPYSQEIFLIELDLTTTQASAAFLVSVPANFKLETLLVDGAIQVVTEGGTPLGFLDTSRCEILVRLLEAGKRLTGQFHQAQGREDESGRPCYRVRVALREI